MMTPTAGAVGQNCQVLRARQRSMRAKLKAGRLDKRKNQLHQNQSLNHHTVDGQNPAPPRMVKTL